LVDKKGEEQKRYDYFEETFLTMCKRLGKMEFGGWEVERTGEEMMIWIIQEEEREKEDEGNKDGFDWEAVIDEAAIEGESARERSFMMRG
ncbi:hypothetical protein Dimus_027507, partial [Dionaea muscipula]